MNCGGKFAITIGCHVREIQKQIQNPRRDFGFYKRNFKIRTETPVVSRSEFQILKCNVSREFN